MSSDDRYLRIAALAALVVTLARLLWLAAGTTDLYPDEAQYWLWSRAPDWGYYSKPPLVAWIIAASTALFGSGTFGIRAAAPVLHLGTSLLVYGIGRRLHDARIGCWSSLVFLTLPGISVSSSIMSTDVPLLFCWAAALYAFIRGREAGGWAWWIVAGAAVGAGLLAKYAMAYWLVSAAFFLILLREERRHLPKLAAAAAVALAIGTPNLLWNAAHGFVTFAHTRDNASLKGSFFHPVALLEFVGSQFGVFGPILFAALLVLIVRRDWARTPAALLACFTLPTLLTVVLLSLLSRSNANWAAPAYVAATVLVVAWLHSEDAARAGRSLRPLLRALPLRCRRLAGRIDARTALSFSVGLHVLVAVVLMGAHDAGKLVGLDIDPYRRLRGFSELGRAVSRLLAEHPLAVIGSEERETLAALAYYVRPGPPPLGKLNSDGVVQDHFDLTADMARFPGRDFLWVTRADEVDFVAPFFDSARRLATITLLVGPEKRRRYQVWDLRGFKGYPSAAG